MSRKIPIYKLVAAGNDFVVLDVRTGSGLSFEDTEVSELARRLCRRRLDIGADGLMLLGDGEGDLAFSMRYFNSDGSHGQACGNGARALAHLAAHLGIFEREARFRTDAGVYRARLEAANTLSIAMSDGRLIEREKDVEGFDGGAIDWLDTGVPHIVIWYDEPEQVGAVDIDTVGPQLRHHPAFQPAGTNVNLAAVIPPENESELPRILIRTFERGVEGETLACGTGCVATAASYVARSSKRGVGDVKLLTAGGDELRAHVRLEAEGRITDVELAGPARLVVEGVTEI